ncbi:MAG: RNA polymerase sigma-70 factor [Bacteroidales bacterium]|jgi:RNA polymerase sigma-70 factor (ECF subfamily)|nr:RNA polymerase sigma-70 factor [Bacteroidales bacterium]
MSDIFLINHASLRQLFDHYFDPLCRYLSYYHPNRMIVEEVVQDVFVKIWNERETLRITSIKAWLFTAARHRMLNHIRDEKRRHTVIEAWIKHESEKTEGEECFNIDEFTQHIQTAVHILPSKCREIFTLGKTENLTYRQIAERLNISVKTVETQMGIALRKIRHYLSDFYPDVRQILWMLVRKLCAG